jgi:hypothetical protein
MGRIKGALFVISVAAASLMAWHFLKPTAGEPVDGEGVPEVWINTINRADPGEDWRKIESASLMELIESGRTKSGGNELDEAWTERGPSTIPGRITDIDIDYVDELLYCVTDHGIVFRGNLDGTDWQPLNDQYPVSQGVGCFLQVIRTAEGIRILSGGWQKTTGTWGVLYSDDLGKTWVVPAGLFNYSVQGIRRCKVTRDAVYIFVQEYHSQKSTDYYTIYKSTDQGLSFTALYRSKVRAGDGSRFTRCDFWMTEDQESGPIYLALEDSMFVVNPVDGTRTYKGQISGIKTANGLLLTGSQTKGTMRLRAWIGDSGTARFFASDDGGTTWVKKGDYTDGVATYPFGYNSFSASPSTGDTLYFGGVLTIRSRDAGATWELVDLDPTRSYALYHGDVPKTLMTVAPNRETDVYFGTDGGLYKRDPAHDHWVSLSIPDLNSTQIYKMVSRFDQPDKMYAGTQDNGYLSNYKGFTSNAPDEFKMIWGGDVTNMASGDNGRTFWVWWWGEGCNYVTVPENDFTLSNFSPGWVNKECPYWEAPIYVPSQNPDQCFTAGRPKGSSGSYLIRIKAQRNAAATAVQYPYNFGAAAGDNVTAIAVSPIDSSYWYVATANGYFFRSTDAGKTWSNKKLLYSSLYARAIYPSKVTLGKVWVGGSGYSNPAVYYSDDNGATFKGVNNGLPKTIVEAFDANPDESLLFAATGVAPMMLRTASGEWSNIAGATAPLVHYMDVEYIPGIETVRFATFARGIWDFKVPRSLGVDEQLLMDTPVKIYPLPASEYLTIEPEIREGGEMSVRLYSISGRLLFERTGPVRLVRLQIAGYDPGLYILDLTINNKHLARKILID